MTPNLVENKQSTIALELFRPAHDTQKKTVQLSHFPVYIVEPTRSTNNLLQNWIKIKEDAGPLK
jgi:hypothetical protein